MRNQKLYKVSEACRVIGLSRYYVNRLILAGELEVVQVGKTQFVTEESVHRFMCAMMEGGKSNGKDSQKNSD